MIAPLKAVIEALRQELQQYGEMLARLDHQQESILRRTADDVLVSVTSVRDQAAAILRARRAREGTQRQLASHFRQPAQATLGQLTQRIPAEYQPLVRALVDENNQLLARVQQRARQNHLLLRRSLDLMQNLLRTLIPAGAGAVYDDSCSSPARNLPTRSVYDGAG
jgi:hypothetical protein